MRARRWFAALVALTLIVGVFAGAGCSALSGQQSAEDAQKFYSKGAKDPNE